MGNFHTTQALLDLGQGDETAASRLMPLVVDELRSLAARFLQSERNNHTLQPTALVNEAFLRLVNLDDIQPDDRGRFLRIAAQAMRRVLVDHARTRNRVKRGGGGEWKRVTLDQAVAPDGNCEVDLVALSDAMEKLAEKKSRLAEVIELRFFGGLTIDETAHVLGVSTTTIDNDWFVARAWLARELKELDNS